MDMETAFAHIEAYIAGGDELGEVSDDALTALRMLEAEVERLRALIVGLTHHVDTITVNGQSFTVRHPIRWLTDRLSEQDQTWVLTDKERAVVD